MKNLDELCINTIRMLSVDMVQQANSGHPGMPMGAAPMAYALWTRFLKHHPGNPAWPDRDRFVLSAGHGSALLYSLLHLTGYDLSLEEMKRFRQLGSKTPGHPEFRETPGVECTTGPLGQGFANGVGMAIAERFLAAHFNRPGHEIVGHYTYAIVSDGDLMEGIASEAASLAGHLKLGKLIYLYDNNHITLAGEIGLNFTEDVYRRFEAYGWHVISVEDGNDTEAISKAIDTARNESSRPSLISIRTHIGYGSPHRQDTFEAHGSPLGPEEVIATKKNLGWPPEPAFYIPEVALAHFREVLDKGSQLEEEWKAKLESYGKAHPDLRTEWDQWMKAGLLGDWDKDIPFFSPDPKGMATRSAGSQVINAIASHLPSLIGGSADLNPSTNTVLKNKGNFQCPESGEGTLQGSVSGPWGYEGANIWFGVREHAMGSILNGMSLHGGLFPFGSTFLIFSDYMRPAIRLAALMKLHVIYIFTHDSIALGEDGPTHQPVEQLASLRAIPGLIVIRPADANETAEAWRMAIEHRKGPVAIILTRQNVPVIDRSKLNPATGLRRGAYVLADSPPGKPEVILIATGSEVHLTLEVYEKLRTEGIAARLISMPSWELFEQQPETYRMEVLPPEVTKRISIEAGATQGWHRYVGLEGEAMGIDQFGVSAPGGILLNHFGFTSENIIARIRALLKKKVSSE
ncbi:MAG: transketolase [Thermodesulfobacteriota bacterium]|nr:transketolase [Thermodesulfobacteriota bacterium]